LYAKITLPQGNNRNISFGNPENAHIFGRREQAPALRYPKDISIDNSSLNPNLYHCEPQVACATGNWWSAVCLLDFLKKWTKKCGFRVYIPIALWYDVCGGGWDSDRIILPKKGLLVPFLLFVFDPACR